MKKITRGKVIASLICTLMLLFAVTVAPSVDDLLAQTNVSLADYKQSLANYYDILNNQSPGLKIVDEAAFTTGGVGTAESTGRLGSTETPPGNFIACSPEEIKDTKAIINDTVTWTLKDGVLFITENNNGNLAIVDMIPSEWTPFRDNPYIETVVVGPNVVIGAGLYGDPINGTGSGTFHHGYTVAGLTANCPNLKTVIFMDSRTLIDGLEFPFCDMREENGQLKVSPLNIIVNASLTDVKMHPELKQGAGHDAMTDNCFETKMFRRMTDPGPWGESLIQHNQVVLNKNYYITSAYDKAACIEKANQMLREAKMTDEVWNMLPKELQKYRGAQDTASISKPAVASMPQVAAPAAQATKPATTQSTQAATSVPSIEDVPVITDIGPTKPDFSKCGVVLMWKTLPDGSKMPSTMNEAVWEWKFNEKYGHPYQG